MYRYRENHLDMRVEWGNTCYMGLWFSGAPLKWLSIVGNMMVNNGFWCILLADQPICHLTSNIFCWGSRKSRMFPSGKTKFSLQVSMAADLGGLWQQEFQYFWVPQGEVLTSAATCPFPQYFIPNNRQLWRLCHIQIPSFVLCPDTDKIQQEISFSASDIPRFGCCRFSNRLIHGSQSFCCVLKLLGTFF